VTSKGDSFGAFDALEIPLSIRSTFERRCKLQAIKNLESRDSLLPNCKHGEEKSNRKISCWVKGLIDKGVLSIRFPFEKRNKLQAIKKPPVHIAKWRGIHQKGFMLGEGLIDKTPLSIRHPYR
jgi:hypothetical protein